MRAIGLFSGQELIGGMLLAERRRRGQTVLETHPMAPYAGWWLAEPAGAANSKIESLHAAALGALDDFLRCHCGKAVVRFDPRFQDARQLIRRGWQSRVQYTYVTEPVPEEGSLQSSFENDARRQIESARTAGITVGIEKDWSVLERLACQTHGRKNLEGEYPDGYLARLGEALAADGAGALHVARSPDGAALAAAMVGWDDERAFYLYGGSSAEAQGTGAPSLLQAGILASLPVKSYDWHGANSPGVVQFKKNFNPRPVPYLVMRKCYGLAPSLAHAAADAWRQWRDGVPRDDAQ